MPQLVDICLAGFGTSQRMGDLDFYPNGGSTQPGCYLKDKKTFITNEGLINGKPFCEALRAAMFDIQAFMFRVCRFLENLVYRYRCRYRIHTTLYS